MSESFIKSIEEATGEAIDEAIAEAFEKEMGAIIDEAIADAVAHGIEAAAIEAGFQAMLDTLSCWRNRSRSYSCCRCCMRRL